MQNLGMLHNLDIFLRNVGNLWSLSVSGVHQHGIIWLVLPRGIVLVHFLYPRVRSTCLLVPANYHTSVTPSFMLDNLTYSIHDMRRSNISRFRTLTKVPVLVPEPEHLHGRTLAHGVRVRVEDVPQSQAHEPPAPLPPRFHSEPILSHLCHLCHQLGNGVRSV